MQTPAKAQRVFLVYLPFRFIAEKNLHVSVHLKYIRTDEYIQNIDGNPLLNFNAHPSPSCLLMSFFSAQSLATGSF